MLDEGKVDEKCLLLRGWASKAKQIKAKQSKGAAESKKSHFVASAGVNQPEY